MIGVCSLDEVKPAFAVNVVTRQGESDVYFDLATIFTSITVNVMTRLDKYDISAVN